jgi:beta-phosphoglucomutase-like phosphatase (HAD superfamily)
LERRQLVPMKLKALIFDVDGTLADTEEAHRRAFNEAFGSEGLDWLWSKPQYAELLRTTGGKERIAAYINGLPLGAAERDAIMERVAALHKIKTANYMRIINAGEVPLRDGVARLLDEAEAAGVALGIATTTTFDNIQALLQTTLGPRAMQRFAVIGAGDQVPRKKPAPDIYKYVLRQLGLRPQDAVAIEDSANGVASAKGAGLFTIVTPSYWTAAEDFAAADLVLPALGSAEQPLTNEAAALIGRNMLGIREIEEQLQAAGSRRS